MSNIIDKIRISGVTYDIQGGGGGIPESAFTAYTAATDARIAEDEEVTAAGLNALNDRLSEDEEVTAAGLNALNEVISGVSGNNVVELTQAEYDAFVTGGTVDPTAFYIITDATAGDLTQYWTSAQTQSAITSATSDFITSEDVCSIASECGFVDAEGVYGILGEGGYLTEGDLSDNQALDDAVGGMGYIKCSNLDYCDELGGAVSNLGFITGEDVGYMLEDYASIEWVQYHYIDKDDLYNDVSVLGFVQESTLADYVPTSAITSAVTSASTNSQVPSAKYVYDKFDEVEQVTAAALNNINDRLSEDEEVTAAGLNAVNDKFDGLKLKKLTQQEYDALVTKDSNTLYIVI